MAIDYNIIQKQSATPDASSMIETFRAIGYNLETAVADIIDNSISAEAKNIYIERIWHGGKSIITIKDDGHGMNDEELVNAMRPGARNPLAERAETDLGRFGLGLKTASFSQCRKLSVMSKKKNSDSVYWSWDLDYVAFSNEWNLIKWLPEGYLNALDDQESGTIVIWTDLDRVLPLSTPETDYNAKRKFSNSLERVRQHIAMTFHRFIEDKTVKIYWCGNIIEPWNPFFPCPEENLTDTPAPQENISGGGTIKGFVLPHKSRVSEKAYKAGEGMNGYPAQQGFYVYRGKRLLLAGDWLGIFRKEEHYKLVRIQIDLPNTLDTNWQIDIKKSKATPPAACRDQIEQYAKKIRSVGEAVFRHRGKILKHRAGQDFQPLWLDKTKGGKWSFVVNRDHLLIKNIKEMAKTEPYHAIDTLLRFIEESIPTKAIYVKETHEETKDVDKQEIQKEPFSDIDINLIKQILLQMFNNQINSGKTPEQAKALLKTIEPFNNYEDLIEEL